MTKTHKCYYIELFNISMRYLQCIDLESLDEGMLKRIEKILADSSTEIMHLVEKSGYYDED